MTGFQDDYEALLAGSGFAELRDWSVVTMTGADRQSFLHNMCTNDIRRLSPGDRCEAFCTNVQGKIVAHLFVIVQQDQFDLLTVPRQAETLINHLDRYIIREDVTLTDTTGESAWVFAGGQMQKLEGPLSDACCQEAWDAVRIESGLPLFGVDFESTNLPQEVSRDTQAISFTKGCYLGQETIARIDALGHVNKKIVLLKFDGETAPPVGLELNVDGKNVGSVTSGCWSPRENAPVGLAMVRRSSNEVGSQLASEFGEATVIAPFSRAN